MKLRILLILCILFPGISMAGKAAYITDHLVITLRSGQGNTFQILKMLPTGSRLEVLEATESGYTKVKTTDGLEGWVRTQYLADEPVAREKLAAAELKIDRMTKSISSMKQELEELRSTHSNINTERDSLSTEKSKLEKELAHLREVAAKPIVLDRENNELRQKNVALEKDIQLIMQENQLLKDRSQREWFVVGALVLFAGIVVGLIIPGLRNKRRSSSW